MYAKKSSATHYQYFHSFTSQIPIYWISFLKKPSMCWTSSQPSAPNSFNFRVRRLKAINALNFYSTLCMAFLAHLSMKPETNALKASIIKTAACIKEKVYFSYYRLEEGIIGILPYAKEGIRLWFRTKRPVYRQLCLRLVIWIEIRRFPPQSGSGGAYFGYLQSQILPLNYIQKMADWNFIYAYSFFQCSLRKRKHSYQSYIHGDADTREGKAYGGGRSWTAGPAGHIWCHSKGVPGQGAQCSFARAVSRQHFEEKSHLRVLQWEDAAQAGDRTPRSVLFLLISHVYFCRKSFLFTVLFFYPFEFLKS